MKHEHRNNKNPTRDEETTEKINTQDGDAGSDNQKRKQNNSMTQRLTE